MRENLVLLSLILQKLKCHLSKVTIHQPLSRKIQRMIGRGKSGGSVRRGDGRRSENEKKHDGKERKRDKYERRHDSEDRSKRHRKDKQRRRHDSDSE